MAGTLGLGQVCIARRPCRLFETRRLIETRRLLEVYGSFQRDPYTISVKAAMSRKREKEKIDRPKISCKIKAI